MGTSSNNKAVNQITQSIYLNINIFCIQDYNEHLLVFIKILQQKCWLHKFDIKTLYKIIMEFQMNLPCKVKTRTQK